MIVVKKLDPLSVAKIQGMIGLIVGLIAGIIIGIVTSIISAMSRVAMGPEEGLNPLSSVSLFGGLGWLAVIILPLLYGIFFFIAGIIGAWLYNVIAKMVGGMKMELEYDTAEPKNAQPQQMNQQPRRP